MNTKPYILRNTDASAHPIIIFIFILAVASFLLLIINFAVEPFMNLIDSDDDVIDPSVSAPRDGMNLFIQIFWPKGLLLTIFLGGAFAVFMEYQKKNYREM